MMANGSSTAALELELRQLPGVVGVGLEDREDVLTVHLLVSPTERVPDLRRRASEVGRSHIDGPVIIEIDCAERRAAGVVSAPRVATATAETPTAEPEGGVTVAETPVAASERVRILAVRVVEEEDEVEVHLSRGGARTVGRGRRGLAEGAVMATVEALESLGARLPFKARAAGSMLVGFDYVVMVSLEPTSGGNDRMGTARAPAVEEAATKATLHALNRFLTHHGVFSERDSMAENATPLYA